jgi:hypothetical protein
MKKKRNNLALGNFFRKHILVLGASGSVFILGLATFTSFKFGYNDGFKDGFKQEIAGRLISPQKDIDTKLNISTDKFIEGIIKLDGEKPSQSFKDAVNSVYSRVILKVADRYGLSETEKKKVLSEYSNISNELVQEHFNKLQSLSKKRESFPSSNLVRLERHAVANDFNTLLTDNICSASSLILTYATLDREFKILLNKSCGFLLQGIVNPWAEEMKARGLVIDITKSKHEIEKHTRQVIAELATSEDQINKTLTNEYKRTLLKGWWIEYDSVASLKIEAKSIVKAGFKLDKKSAIRIVPSTQTIHVTLPKAIILSNSVEYKILDDKNDFFNHISTERRNSALDELRRSSEQSAIQNGILNKAEINAENIIRYFYSPITNLPGSPFKVVIEIQK